MLKLIKPTLLFISLMLTLFLGSYLKPTLKSISAKDMPDFSKIVPESFGEWSELKDLPMVVADPEMQKSIDEIYNQTLNRTYINQDGRRIMLAIAYGVDQSDSMQAHRPEQCYPAQGFQIKKIRKSVIRVSGVNLPVKILTTQMGASRQEFVLYWILVGDKATSGGLDRKIHQLSYGLKGEVPDGLLFRISSIGKIEKDELDLQRNFLKSFFSGLDSSSKLKLIGK